MADHPEKLFETRAARATITRPAEHVVLLTVSGVVGREMAIDVGLGLDEVLARGGDSFTFWDLENLQQYDSRLRIDCTQVLRKHWPKVKSITVLARSPIVRMGVAVANLALDNRIESHATRLAWKKRLDAALRDFTAVARGAL
jgi:hypothetical protein